MTIPMLPNDLAQFVTDQIGSGKYASEAEVMLDGLRLLRDRERRIVELREQIAPALKRLERGEGQGLSVEDVISRGEERLRQAETQP
ncbi:MAG: type II toxin-antitoxin system ParD family antitoxin [Pirellulales bacterium]